VRSADPVALAAAVIAHLDPNIPNADADRLWSFLTTAAVEESMYGFVALVKPPAAVAERLLAQWPRTKAGQIPMGIFDSVQSALTAIQAAEPPDGGKG